MNAEDKKELMKEFKAGEGTKRLELWDYALTQQVIWEELIAEMQRIAKEQGVDKKLEKMLVEEEKKVG